MAIFYNQATLSYNGYVTNSNLTSGEIVDSLSFTKEAISLNYDVQDAVAYVIRIANGSNTALTGVTVTDDLGEYTLGTNQIFPLEYVAGSLQLFIDGTAAAAPTVTAGPPLVISNFTVPAGSNALIIYEARANEFAPLAEGSSITNTATLGSGETDSATVPVRVEPNLSITKVMSPDTVSDNDTVSYTFILQNTGNEATNATDDLIVSDTFDPILSAITVSFNGTAWAEGTNYTYDEATGAFTTLAGQITVPAATFTQNTETGAVTVNPVVSIIEITGTI